MRPTHTWLALLLMAGFANSFPGKLENTAEAQQPVDDLKEDIFTHKEEQKGHESAPKEEATNAKNRFKIKPTLGVMNETEDELKTNTTGKVENQTTNKPIEIEQGSEEMRKDMVAKDKISTLIEGGKTKEDEDDEKKKIPTIEEIMKPIIDEIQRKGDLAEERDEELVKDQTESEINTTIEPPAGIKEAIFEEQDRKEGEVDAMLPTPKYPKKRLEVDEGSEDLQINSTIEPPVGTGHSILEELDGKPVEVDTMVPTTTYLKKEREEGIEDLEINATTESSADIGESITVEVHRKPVEVDTMVPTTTDTKKGLEREEGSGDLEINVTTASSAGFGESILEELNKKPVEVDTMVPTTTDPKKGLKIDVGNDDLEINSTTETTVGSGQSILEELERKPVEVNTMVPIAMASKIGLGMEDGSKDWEMNSTAETTVGTGQSILKELDKKPVEVDTVVPTTMYPKKGLQSEDAVEDSQDDLIQWSPNFSSFISKGTDKITSSIWKGCRREACNFDAVYSPLGYHLTLTMLHEGAEGGTKWELENLLHLPQWGDEKVRQGYKDYLNKTKIISGGDLKIETRIYFDIKSTAMDRSFRDIAEEYYNATVHSSKLVQKGGFFEINPEKLLNSDDCIRKIALKIWDEEDKRESFRDELPGTNNLREKLQLPLEYLEEQNDKEKHRKFVEHVFLSTQDRAPFTGAENKFFILNEVLFDGKWKIPFQKSSGKTQRPFYLLGGSKVDLEFMETRGIFKGAMLSDLECRVVELDFVGDRFSLLVFSPLKKDGIDELAFGLSNYSISNVVEQLYEDEMTVAMPPIADKFMLSSASEWVDGKNIILGCSNYDGIAPGVFMSRLAQTIRLSFASEDYSTNAISGSYISGRSLTEADFVVDRPFVFHLIDKVEGVVLFTGRISHPMSERGVTKLTHLFL